MLVKSYKRGKSKPAKAKKKVKEDEQMKDEVDEFLTHTLSG